ncbi:MAG: GNAT family N-acetyltransferase [Oscillospiraceae bacterium]|nr:GNAT family N-acetyltransferase [Oscillospiraceae bacterium]
MGDIVIREASGQDAKELIGYRKRIGGESDNLTYGPEGLPVTEEEERGFLQRMHEDRHSVFYCAWKGEKLVGTGSLGALSGRMGHRSELAVSVIKEEWNRGIGGELMKKLIEYARANGVEIIDLEVRSDHARAIHLYEKYGFRHIGTSPAFFKIGGRYVDFELMYLDLR